MAKFRIVWMGPEEDPEGNPRDATPQAVPSPLAQPCYEQLGTELVRREQLQNGGMKCTPLANFTARIVRDIVYDDDPEHRREFGLEIEIAGTKIALVVPAAEFARMGWILPRLGSHAIVYPGQQQHVRAAIQSLSGAVKQERLFTRLGWTKHGDGPVHYLRTGAFGGIPGIVAYPRRVSPTHYEPSIP